MQPFRLADPDLAALGAGRPSPGTLALLRRAQLSRHLLLLREIRLRAGRNPRWYDRLHAMPPGESRDRIADPMTGLWAAQVLSALRDETAPACTELPEIAGQALSVTHAGRALTVRLDDRGPLRHLLGLAPAEPLTPAEVARWRDSLGEAWRILTTRHPGAADIVEGVLRVIVPARPDPRAEGVSATSAAAFGAVALSAPANGTSLAVALLHETQHSVLNAVHGLFELVRPDDTLGYSPWRDDPRPASGILHGVYAFLAVTRFWRAELRGGSGAGEAAFEFARWRAAVHESAGELLAGGRLTAAGNRLAGAVRDEAGPWRSEPVGAEVERLADLARADHHVRWRLRNLTVAHGDVAALAEAWHAGRAAPVVRSVVTASPRVVEPSPRLRMIRELLRGDPAGPAHPGDAAWVRGDAGAALTAYRMGLGKDRDQERAWSGLALVSPHPALRSRPELVRAAARALPEADIADLAAWLSGGERSCTCS
ncbi:hypothetical protein Acy02nite_22450 [Actinoplanes cyaneus]|uniref:HEXXH motif domain-containing protein n=1 Tax=Actinoplanes cyaneus TaxID=52696 RepID=A0A919IEX0_9ACTN|nr:HEXXH motif-containing putative peptide modification protein [Actinoplanes cyaneus]MCW2136490.1 HEXXH motif-containing protein [Actinoplanes cyaneus]GID64364.1 hypothetical protein Acy02nite_22450 [Actinoplanes cyaneus]